MFFSTDGCRLAACLLKSKGTSNKQSLLQCSKTTHTRMQLNHTVKITLANGRNDL